MSRTILLFTCLLMACCSNTVAQQLTVEKSETGKAKGAAAHHYKYAISDTVLIYEYRLTGVRSPETKTDTIALSAIDLDEIMDKYKRNFMELDPDECLNAHENGEVIYEGSTSFQAKGAKKEDGSVFKVRGTEAALLDVECYVAISTIEGYLSKFVKKK
jgi:hypothetical protein